MHSFSMRPAKYFYDKPLPKYIDEITVLIYRPHPVFFSSRDGWQYNGDPLRLPAMQFDAYKVKKTFSFAVF